LRYHDTNHWPHLRDALKAMGRADLIGNGKHHLIPSFQPMTDGSYVGAWRKNSNVVGSKVKGRTGASTAAVAPAAPMRVAAKPGRILTQHTGLPPRKQK
jgi:hypothetical protein